MSKIKIVIKSEPSLYQKYLAQKSHPIYQLPTTNLKIMKGQFFYNHQIELYQRDPTGWWYSEKLDGVQAIWTGQELVSRTNKPIAAPGWWLKQLPINIALAGELFTGRRKFSEIQSIVHTKIPSDSAWQHVTYCLFDLPDSKLTFEENYQIMTALVKGQLPNYQPPKYLRLIPQQPITSLDQFLSAHRQLVSHGAEGTVIRDPMSVYLPYQTDRLLKFKSQIAPDGQWLHLFDNVAVITGYNLSEKWTKADSSPALKSLEVRWCPSDTIDLDNPIHQSVTFSVSGHITKAEKCADYTKLFPIGAQIRVLYNELNSDSGKPRFPRFGGLVR